MADLQDPKLRSQLCCAQLCDPQNLGANKWALFEATKLVLICHTATEY